MSTAQQSAAEGSTGNSFATLVRGRVYYLKDREFLNGKPVAVSAEERTWLEENAYDLVSVEGEGEHQVRPKFRFSSTAEAADKSSTPRSRARAQ